MFKTLSSFWGKVMLHFCFLIFFLSGFLLAHEGTSIESEIEGPDAKVIGSVEFRPSYETGTGNVFGENIFELGYQFSHKFQLAFEQEAHHNIAMQEENPEHEGLGLHLETGLVKAHIHEVWESTDEKSSLSLEPQIHFPMSAEDREKGFVTAGLTYLKFRTRLSDQFSLSLIDAPMVFAYSVPGATVGEEFEANPVFQNRAQLALSASFFNNKFNIALPVLAYLTRHSNYDPEAAHNNAWKTFIGLAPQIEYFVSSNLSAGIAIITPNLLDANDADHSVNHGRTSTVNQFFLRASL